MAIRDGAEHLGDHLTADGTATGRHTADVGDEDGSPAGDADPAAATGPSRDLRDASRADKWSVAFVMLAAALWAYFAYLMLASYGPELHDGEPRCKGPLIEPFEQDGYHCHSELRQWPALLGILALSTVASVIAAATTVHARVLARLAGRAPSAPAPPS
ncbi:hypothetical protein [Streptomyces sp. NPDC057336]|uniref:hypothetical protein n=1 Tax=Streptomyces sp. NPDC057336 TaxID=3346102 RepID=UPI0036417DAB